MKNVDIIIILLLVLSIPIFIFCTIFVDYVDMGICYSCLDKNETIKSLEYVRDVRGASIKKKNIEIRELKYQIMEIENDLYEHRRLNCE